ncbi:tyrosine-type recombinase/integrase [Comamonas flocculans]|uniref:Tyrosine-type recombinase/integrase n=1 Tax=Comamonas flocculans TaxID=2597701 RepID=A0A5B8RWU9_9BURK|nr:site-specific integrase [Comamonas flocculans]QEA13553.1 tyrosine-type recombinase/integrase [Comamonas flocculans]
MPRIAKQLSERAVAAIKQPGRRAVGGVQGLHLLVSPTGWRSWVLRVVVAGTRKDWGLGAYPGVSLAAARDAARAVHDSIRAGEVPEPATSKRKRLAAEQLANTEKTFDFCVERFLDAKGVEWRNAKHRAQWRSTLAQYASPVLGALPVSEIERRHVLAVLTQPVGGESTLWLAKNETASRLRGRIERVLDWAAASGYRRSGENPAAWRGHLDALLPAPGKIQKTEHHRALPYADIPAFIAALRKRDGAAARALEFAILTAARSGEVRGATWDELDFENRLWTIPAGRMKAGREHRVPLSAAAVTLLKKLPGVADSPYVFPGARGPLSDMSLTAVLRRMNVDCVPHGFRSSFRDWAAAGNWPRELAELSLAHVTKGKVEAAYWRADALDKRRELMQAWAEYCQTHEETPPKKGGVNQAKKT